MTDEEYEARCRQLINEINALEADNMRLEADIDWGITNMIVLTGNIKVLKDRVGDRVDEVNDAVVTVDDNTEQVRIALDDLTNRYFLFKNLSTASKNLTQLTDEYYTRFKLYNKLRRITLGFVIGIDSAIISNESLRKEVEKSYLQNTEYWLAYAIAAVMLWASNEKEAAERAVKKAISMDVCKSDVFFLLVNLRFERLKAAKNWYADYLEKVDLTELGSEYQYLLQAYLAGLFGNDPEFSAYVEDNFKKSLAKIDALTVDFSNKFTKRAKDYANVYLHSTEAEFPTLYEISPDYEKLKELLSKAECNSIFARNYADLASSEEVYAEDQAQRIEDVLYNLINAYDDEEWKVIKQIKYNDAIMAAKGDLDAAEENYELNYANIDKKRSLDELMLDWAFSDDPLITNITIKRFTIQLMKDAIAKGFTQFAEEYRKQEPEKVKLTIDDYSLECDENDFENKKSELENSYSKDRVKNTMKDKYVVISGVACLVSILIIILTAINQTPVVLAVGLTVGVLGGIVSGFVLWRRIVEVGRILEEKKRLGVLKLKAAIEEIKKWRENFKREDAHNDDVKAAMEQF